MQVLAFATPAAPAWRWRIVNYAGEMVEESHETFPTIAAAVARGTERLVKLDAVDPSPPAHHWRSASRRRAR
jgi:hypothetical protein